jgi:cytochrome b
MMEQVADRRPDRANPSRVVSSTKGRVVRIWDLPTRLFHWLLLFCIVGSVASAQVGGNWMEWHVRFGAAALGLLSFRLVWGVIGPRYARFTSFLYSPRVVLSSLRRIFSDPRRHAGHSPTGALSVYALLGVLLVQALSGLFSSDSISTEGPLVAMASESTVGWATWVHVTLQWAIYGLVALHVAAVTAYLAVKKDNLIGAMVHGDKAGLEASPTSDTAVVRVAGIGLMAVSVGTSLWLCGG